MTENFYGATVHRTKYRWGLCLGQHIFIGEKSSEFALNHEYGHHIQWRNLRWKYYFLIGIPSLLHALLWIACGKRWNYYSFRPEAQANNLSSLYFGKDITKKE